MRFFKTVVLWLVCVTGIQAQIALVPTVQHLASASTPSAGAINLAVSGGLAPYTYLWSPGGYTTQNISSKPYGAYSVKVRDANGDTAVSSLSIGYKVQWDQMYGSEMKGDTLRYSGPSLWGQAVSKNTLAPSTDGWVEYVLDDINRHVFLGFSDSISPTMEEYRDIDYGFYYQSEFKTLYRIINGAGSAIATNIPAGSVLKIERIGNTINLKVNDVTNYTATDAVYALQPLKTKGLVSYLNGSLINVACSFYSQGNTFFPGYIRLIPTIVHSSGLSANDGSIKVSAAQAGTYGYTWQPGSVSSSSLASLSAGVYSVTGQDNVQNSSTAAYNLGYKVKWDQMYNMSNHGDTLEFIGSTTYGQAVSKNTLAANTDGWVEYVLKDLDQIKSFGFTDSISPIMEKYSDIDYGFYYQGSGTSRLLYGIVGGAIFFISTNAPMPEGTVFRIERIGSSINLKINNVLYNSWTDATYAHKAIKIKSVVHTYLNGSLINVGCSFYSQGNIFFPGYIRLNPTIVHSSGPSANDGSIKVAAAQAGTYSYTWQPGSIVSSSVTSLSAGVYSVTGQDNVQNSSTAVYNLGYKVKWDQMYNMSNHGDTLEFIGSTTYGQAVSKNTLAANTDGWVEYVLKDLDQIKSFGFVDSISPIMEKYSDIDYGFYYEGSGATKRLYGIAGGSLFFISTNAALPEGTVFRIERIGSSINLKINNVLYNSWTDVAYTYKPIKIKSVVHTYLNGSLINVGCSFYGQGNTFFPGYIRLNPTIVHSSGPSANDGSIKVSAAQTGTYSYTWQPGSVVSSSLTSLSAAVYSVTVKDSLQHYNAEAYSIGYKLQWDQLYSSATSQDTLQNSGAAWRGQAVSKNTLAASTDGWIEYVLRDLYHDRFLGFSDSISSVMGDYADIDYGIYYESSNRILYVTGGGGFGALYINIPENSLIRIERVGNTVTIKINGIVFYTTTDAVFASKAVKIKGLVYLNSSLINVGCSFSYSSALALSPVITNYTNEDDRGTIDLHMSGGSPNYNIAWNGLKVKGNHQYYRDLDSAFGGSVDSLSLYNRLDNLRGAQTLSNIPSAIYNNTIKDQAGDSIHATTLVGNKFGWITTGVSTNTCVIPPDTASSFMVYYGQGQKLTKTSSGTGLNYAVSDRILSAADRELYIEAGIVNTTDEMAIGLKTASALEVDSISDMIMNTIIHFKGAGTKSMDIYYAGSLVRTMDYLAGDAVGILLNPKNRTLIYYRNFSPVYTQTNVPENFFNAAYQFKALLKTPGAQLSNIILVGQAQPMRQITTRVNDITCNSIGKGALTFNAQSMLAGEAVCSYTVAGPGGYSNTGSVTGSNVLTGLYAGVYTITAQVRSGSCAGTLITTMGQTFTVAYMPDWINQSPFGATNVNTTDRSFNITAVQSSPYTWLGGASSDNVLAAGEEGWAEFSPMFSGSYTSTRALAFGFNNEDLGPHPSDNDHGFYISSSIPVVVIGLGGGSAQSVGPYTASLFTLGNPGTLFNFSPTDLLKIKKVSLNGGLNMKMEFYKNNVLIPSPNTVYPATDLVADISVNQKDVYINKPRITFACSTNIPYYFVLKKILDAGYYTSYRKKIYFTFEEEYFDPAQGSANSLSYNIVTDANLPVNTSPGLIEVIGDNRFKIDLSTVTGMIAGRFYRIAITNKKNEVFYARFKY